jgi:hypothetical protein
MSFFILYLIIVDGGMYEGFDAMGSWKAFVVKLQLI